ncbi:hypothetical protein GDO78_003398 [Eleutherodactylus coqui]|uniref:Uncharacterized protein n=1 Tax=Eleutherodactylus coqui TaxID=57060 RepID=A0A8J6ETP4_ELECQ|nr:hypothetical protein GDO78_003398 [Eleutherodactylus coqui]
MCNFLLVYLDFLLMPFLCLLHLSVLAEFRCLPFQLAAGDLPKTGSSLFPLILAPAPPSDTLGAPRLLFAHFHSCQFIDRPRALFGFGLSLAKFSCRWQHCGVSSAMCITSRQQGCLLSTGVPLGVTIVTGPLSE